MSIAPTPTVQHDPSSQSAALAGRFASEYLHALSPEQEFSARRFFDRFPDYARFKSVVLEVTLEEYVRRSCAGEQVPPSQIAGQFPEYRTAIARQIEVYQFLEESAGMDDAVHWPEPGDKFLGLHLRELLGTGAFSKVFLATEEQLGGRQVVVKVCRGAGEEPAFLGRLGHPHITPIHWHRVCGTTGLSAIVMPFVARSTMADVIDRCYSYGGRRDRAAEVGDAVAELHSDLELTIDRTAFAGTFADGALRWATQLADALAFAHQHRICHSDIKPSNVLLTPAGSAVLVDFSMANDLAIDRKTVGGTFPYMAPEQLEAFLSGRDIPVSFATDLFSLGVTLYEFLTGRPPFGCPPANDSRHATATWLLKKHRGTVMPVSSINPRIPESLSSIVMQCLAVEPERRPLSATALCAQLKHEASVSRRIVNDCRRHKWKISAVGASIVLTASLAIVHAMTGPPPFEVELQRGRAALEQGEAVAAVEHLTRGIDALPPEMQATPMEAKALFDRGRACLGSGQFAKAAADFADAREIQPRDALITAALGYCEARMAFSKPLDQTESRIESARRLFTQAANLEQPTPRVRFDLAYLEFWLIVNGRLTPEERRNPQLRLNELMAGFDSINSELNTVVAELGHIPNVHLLLVRMEYELGVAAQSRIDPRRADAAAKQFPNDPRILTEAAFTWAWNARVDEGARREDLKRSVDYWNLALQNGATHADWNHLESLTDQIPDAPPFRAPVSRTRSNSSRPDLLLNPLDDREAEFSAQIATTGM